MKNEILRRLSALALGLALLLNAAPLPQAFAVEDDTDASSSDSADSTDTADKTAVTTADSDPTVTAAAANAPALDATAALLVSPESDMVLYEKNADERLSPASVTKIMTLLLIFEQLDSGQLSTDAVVTASGNACAMGGSQIWLKEGEQMSVDEMLKCIAVNSANDCAVAMAEHISGSEEAFTKRMNDRAKELGMENTQFLNCTGLTDDPGHYTTARDIACMSRALLAHPRIRDYTTIWMDTVRDGRFGLANTNKLIHAYPGATGLKTGYTQQAMHCLSASAERDGVEYIAVVLHAESSKARFADAATLLNFAFANYSLYSVAANTVISPVRVRFAETDSVQPVLSGTDAIVVRKGMAAPQTDIALNEDLCAPLEPGAQVGTVTVTDSSGDTLILPLVVPDGAARISTAHLWLQLLRAL